MDSLFWVNNVYSLGHWLKDYGYYPSFLPLFTYMDHGMTGDYIFPHEIDNKAAIMFKFQPRLIAEYSKKSKKPVYCLLNPSIHYRIKKGIKKKENAKGTLFFVAHSTPNIDDLTNWNLFIDQLREVPEEFMPLEICLHHHDVKKGLNKIFEDKGFNVRCVGSPDNVNFIETFYDIITEFKYTMSNLFGSYAYYSIDLGIPFSLYGKGPEYMNSGDLNIKEGDMSDYTNQMHYKESFSLFAGFHTVCNQSQLDFVNYELGKYDTISRKQASILLYTALFKFIIKYPHIFAYTIIVLPLKKLLKKINRKN